MISQREDINTNYFVSLPIANLIMNTGWRRSIAFWSIKEKFANCVHILVVEVLAVGGESLALEGTSKDREQGQ